jgi:Rieske Fe-S protein
MKPISRRAALATVSAVGSVALLGGCLPQNSNPGASLASKGAKVGTLSSFPSVGSFIELDLADTPTVVIRLEKASKSGLSVGEVHLIALSKVCTHLGCLINAPKDAVLGCACHGSLFDASTGAALRGPAGTPLASFKLEARADGIYAVG